MPSDERTGPDKPIRRQPVRLGGAQDQPAVRREESVQVRQGPAAGILGEIDEEIAAEHHIEWLNSGEEVRIGDIAGTEPNTLSDRGTEFPAVAGLLEMGGTDFRAGVAKREGIEASSRGAGEVCHR